MEGILKGMKVMLRMSIKSFVANTQKGCHCDDLRVVHPLI